MAASGMRATRPRPVVEGPSVASWATTKRPSAAARMSISRLAPSRQPRARLERLNGASASCVRSLCHLSLIGPCGPSTETGTIAGASARRSGPIRHAGGRTRAPGMRRSVAASKTSESPGAKPILTASPAACAAEEPCSSTRTCADVGLHDIEDLASHGLDLGDAAGAARLASKRRCSGRSPMVTLPRAAPSNGKATVPATHGAVSRPRLGSG